MCVHREEFVSCDSILKYKLKVGLVIGCAKPLIEATVYSHFNETINMLQARRPNG